MIVREFTCVVCPNGCRLLVEVTDEEHPKVLKVDGATCNRGEPWAVQEVENPMRTIASSVKLEGGSLPLVSVRLTQPVSLAKIGAVMDEIKKATLKAPVRIGQVVLKSPAGTDTEVIVTKNVGLAG